MSTPFHFFARWRFAVPAALLVILSCARAQIASDPVNVPIQFQGLYDAVDTGDPNNQASISITPNGSNYATGAGMAGTGIATSNAFCRVVPGRAYTFTIQTYSIQRVQVKITAPDGYRVFINGVEHELFDWEKGDGSLLDPFGSFTLRLDLSTGAPVAQAESLRPGRVLWSVGLGNLRNGKPAGTIGIAENGLTTNTFTPNALFYDRDPGTADGIGDDGEVEAIKINGVLRQVYATTVLVDINADNDHTYRLDFYPRDTGQIGSKSNGVYAVSGTPLFEFKVENPTYPSLDALRITKTTNQNGQLVMWTEMRKQSAPSGQEIWLVQDWVEQPSGATSVSSPVQERWTYSNNDLNELCEVLDSNGNVIRSDLKVYQDLNFVFETSRELVSDTVGTGASAVTTSYSYFQTLTSPGGWHKFQTITSTDGSWTGFNYEDDYWARGQVLQVRRPHKNSPASDPGLNATVGEVTTISHSFVDNFGTKVLPTQIETKIDNTVTARSQISYAYETVTDNSADYTNPDDANMPVIVATRNDFTSDGTYLTTTTRTYRQDADPENRFFTGLPYSVQRPDGTMTAMAYFHVDFVSTDPFFMSHSGGARARVAIQGMTDPTVGTADTNYAGAQALPANFRILSGKSSMNRVLLGEGGLQVIAENQIYTGSWMVTQRDWTNYINAIWVSGVQRQSDASGPLWDVVQNTWTQGRLTSTTDEHGIQQTFGYDSVGRVQTITRTGATYSGSTIADITTTNTYDAAGAVTQQTVSSPGVSESITHQSTFDTAGRVATQQTPEMSGPVRFTYDVTNRQATQTLPTGDQRIETRFADGQLASITGSAVVAEYYDYTIESDGRRHSQVNLGSSSGARKRETRADWLGRTVEQRHPGFSGQQDYVETMTYDPSTGLLAQSTRTGYAPTVYQYNAMAQLTRKGLDRGSDGLNLDSQDRINDYDTSFEYYSGAYWVTSNTWTYPYSAAGSRTTAKRINTARQRLTGLSGSLRAETHTIDAEGNDSGRTTTVDVTNKAATVTMTSPGVSGTSIEQYLDGLLVASTGFDGLTTKRAYDALARLQTVTDPRNNATTTGYQPGTTLPATVTDAANDQVAFGYDTLGRKQWTRDAAGNYTYFGYTSRSELWRQWGGGSYPVQYGYDGSTGDRTSMTTYRGGTGWDQNTWPSGAGTGDSTNWTYDPGSGLLASKADALGRSTDYTYNLRGQVDTRTWARTLVNNTSVRVQTSYTYDGETGELTDITYNDGGDPIPTAPVHYNYTRLGQFDSVTDATGLHAFTYDPNSPWRLNVEGLDGVFYSARAVTYLFDAASSTGGSYGGYTTGTVKGANTGFELGVTGAMNRDLHQSYTFSNLGRFVGVNTRAASGAARDFVYSYYAIAGSSTPSKLIGGYSNGSNFSVSRSYETNRDLLTDLTSSVTSGSGAGVITQFDFAYDQRGLRKWAKQSGAAFSDYYAGTGQSAVYNYYTYNPRGEMYSAAMYRGDSPPSDASDLISGDQLPGRHFEFRYDNIGNRATAGATGSHDGGDEQYTTNAANEYVTKENNNVRVLGTAAPTAGVAIANTAVTKVGRSFGADVAPQNTLGPTHGTVTVYAGFAGASSISTDTRSWVVGQQTQQLSYDLDGNLTNDGLWAYTYDAENRLVRMSNANVLPAGMGFTRRELDFKYDYLSRRVEKRVYDVDSGQQTLGRRFIYNGNNLIAETDVSGNLLRSYTWGLDVTGSLSAAGGVGALLQLTNHHGDGSTTAYFPTYDGNGNIASLVREDGTLAAVYEYSPFGEPLRAQQFDSAINDNPFRFSTKYWDSESGLVYYGARYYSPTFGRFINRDPIAEQGGLNLYGFCGNDGVDRFDVLGYSFFSKFWNKFRHTIVSTVIRVVGDVVGAYFGMPTLGEWLSSAYNIAVGAHYGGLRGAAWAAAGSYTGYGGGYVNFAATAHSLYSTFGHGGNFFTNFRDFGENYLVAAGTQAALAGGRSAATGGSFGQGFSDSVRTQIGALEHSLVNVGQQAYSLALDGKFLPTAMVIAGPMKFLGYVDEPVYTTASEPERLSPGEIEAANRIAAIDQRIYEIEHPSAFAAVVGSFREQSRALMTGARIGEAAPYVAAGAVGLVVAAPVLATVGGELVNVGTNAYYGTGAWLATSAGAKTAFWLTAGAIVANSEVSEYVEQSGITESLLEETYEGTSGFRFKMAQVMGMSVDKIQEEHEKEESGGGEGHE